VSTLLEYVFIFFLLCMIQKLCVEKKWISPGLSIEILRQIFYILSSEYPRFFEMSSIHSIANFTIFGIMTMTKGLYDHGLSPNRGFCQREIFLNKKLYTFRKFFFHFSQDYKLLRLNT